MTDLNTLLDRRESLVDKYCQIWSKADREGRDLSPEECLKLDLLDTQIVAVTRRIAADCERARIRAALA